MALITDAISDAVNENLAILKYCLYAIPVFICAKSYLAHNFVLFYFLLVPTVLLLLALMSKGISNSCSNNREILTLNIFSLLFTVINMLMALLPYALLLTALGFIITTFVKIPFEQYNLQLIFNTIVWLILFSIFFTAFLSFSKSLKVVDAYKIKVISDSCMDVLTGVLFLIPQLLIVDGIMVALAWYVFFFFKWSCSHPLFIYYCSVLVIFNVSFLANYFAQLVYEHIKCDDEDYKDNYSIKGNVRFNDTNKD